MAKLNDGVELDCPKKRDINWRQMCSVKCVNNGLMTIKGSLHTLRIGKYNTCKITNNNFETSSWLANSITMQLQWAKLFTFVVANNEERLLQEVQLDFLAGRCTMYQRASAIRMSFSFRHKINANM